MKQIVLGIVFWLMVAPVSARVAGEHIMGQGGMTAAQLQFFFMKYNPDGDMERAARLAQMYITEADMEGVNHDVAFAQMILETGWLRFTGLVKHTMNNFCGLGATGEKHTGHTFDSEQIGVRAHVQHLKAYASKESPNNPIVDPRYHYVSPKGKAPTVSELSGTWAKDVAYGEKIKALLKKMQQL